MASRQSQFNINVFHTINDDAWMAESDEIDGFVVESEGFENFLADLAEVSSAMLKHNHGFTDGELNETKLCCHVTHEYEVDEPVETLSGRPELLIRELQLAVA